MPREVPERLRLCWTDPVTGEARSIALEGALRIGSNRQNDVVLPIRSVEPFHAEILGNREGGWEVVAIGLRRLKIGDTMAPRASLSSGAEFSVGSVALRVRAGEPALRRPTSSTGSRRAFTVPPAPRAPAPAGWHALAGVALAVATVVAAWTVLRTRVPDPGETAKKTGAPAAAPGRAHAKARPPTRPSLLEAGSLALAPAADAPAADPAGSVTVLLRLEGSSVPARGFLATSAGLVVTNLRPVAGADSILVRAGAAAPVPARLVASDPAHDLALLEADFAAPPPVARLDDDEAGRRVAASLAVSVGDLRAFVASHR
ncbi:MAG TPA: hypothetical protein VMN04_03385 [Thermoanaerobaculia bacterium]|nr:hypothetical protein [Thermoanaerobaculia bacterium]